MSPWPLTAAEFHGVFSHTGSIKITKNGVSMHSDDAGECRITLTMSSGLYSRLLAMQEGSNAFSENTNRFYGNKQYTGRFPTIFRKYILFIRA
jgi:hypothetical protein